METAKLCFFSSFAGYFDSPFFVHIVHGHHVIAAH